LTWQAAEKAVQITLSENHCIHVRLKKPGKRFLLLAEVVSFLKCQVFCWRFGQGKHRR
jgi:hypothetical protein